MRRPSGAQRGSRTGSRPPAASARRPRGRRAASGARARPRRTARAATRSRRRSGPAPCAPAGDHEQPRTRRRAAAGRRARGSPVGGAAAGTPVQQSAHDPLDPGRAAARGGEAEPGDTAASGASERRRPPDALAEGPAPAGRGARAPAAPASGGRRCAARARARRARSRSSLPLERVAQRVQRAAQPRVDRPAREVEQRAISPGVYPSRWRSTTTARWSGPARRARRSSSPPGRAAGGGVGQLAHLGAARAGAGVVDRAVDDDPVQPRRERAAPVEAVERPQRGEERLLGDVLGRGRVVDDQVGRAMSRGQCRANSASTAADPRWAARTSAASRAAAQRPSHAQPRGDGVLHGELLGRHRKPIPGHRASPHEPFYVHAALKSPGSGRVHEQFRSRPHLPIGQLWRLPPSRSGSNESGRSVNAPRTVRVKP